MFEAGGVRDAGELKRRLAVTAALLIVYRLGLHVPLPGLDQQVIAQLGGVSGAFQRVSILTLGIAPFVTVLVLAELGKVLAPSLRAWERAEPRNRALLSRLLVLLGLMAAAAQASGLALAMEDIKGLVAEPGTAFRLTCIGTLVAGTAALIWLADTITRHGLGSGVWLLFLAPFLAEVPGQTMAVAALQLDAGTAAIALVIGAGLLVLLLAALIALLSAGGARQLTAATSLWSVMLAKATWPWLIILVALGAGAGSLAESWLVPGHPLSLLVLAALVALYAVLYRRSEAGAEAESVGAVLPVRIVAAALAVITFVEMLAATWAAGVVPLAGQLTMSAAVALVILWRWWVPPAWNAHGEAEPE